MPELPEVETVRRGLEPALVGARFQRVTQRRPDLRFPFPDDFAARLEGQEVRSLGRRAKYLLADLSSGEVLVMHLGMSGRFLVSQGGETRMPGEFHHEHGGVGAHDHVIFELSNGARVTYNDARRFGFMDLVPRPGIETCRHFAGMGIEPLGNELSGDTIARLFAGKRTPLKAALLDQRLIAGLGNIYVCEALFRTGLHPEAAAGTLATKAGEPTEQAHRLAGVIRDVLNEAVLAGGSTLRDHAQVDGSLGYFQHSFKVYDREGEPCVTPGCGGTVSRLVQSGRSTFYCPVCQS
ncbi:bifunctional DNA-formamidopyrimidine glycosylase/DNA-(apurinic or apyrimidinic site) lyase [Microvirga pudoricolor]|uniref:bifunctional DNA-formamidopyrimidine glycosylase/DNA-(apurinic or apyrimidinic site) lyase n=1 Tax=Microvirga pudoricolor TaxID=2778729 RepID=UPI00194F0ABA|nr:bifunctional DNA-formamidopyrimidine glycosylase/DNA-(apurinic or apyrimidinic site) lyase [Microvirga pudoricolor]MBM6594088.1 bifunctional DNA-formamidopyrimidine glycosylase/DNA-(apurinic or apyrimidinic site) lyase [Microvirga pudoricolor]